MTDWVGCEYMPRAGTDEGLGWLRRPRDVALMTGQAIAASGRLLAWAVEQAPHASSRARLGQEPALQLAAAGHGKQPRLAFVLDAFGRHLEVERAGQPDRGADELADLLIVDDAVDRSSDRV